MTASIGPVLRRTMLAFGLVAAGASARASAAEGGADQGEAAQPPPSIATSGTCPESEAVTAAIAALLPRGGLEALPPYAAAEVSDLGETYRATVRVKGRTWIRVYRDVARNCEQRARFAAVFIVLTLVPPELLVESAAVTPPPPPPSPPPPPAAVSAVALAMPAPRRWWFELAALTDMAPPIRDAPRLIAPGLELRAGRRLGRLAGVGAVGLEPRTTFDLGALEARAWRVPFDVGARAWRAVGPTELGGELGLCGAVLHAEGVNPPTPNQGTRLEIGARLGLTGRLGWPRGRVAPVVGVHAILIPRPYALTTTPGGSVGHTPTVWIGATMGVATTLF